MKREYRNALTRLETKAAQHVFKQAQQLRNEWVVGLSAPGTGRVYGNHQASAPGEAPAVDSGQLRSAVQVARIDRLTWGVGLVAIPYPDGNSDTATVGALLERGTRTAAMRPHARPALDGFIAKYRRLP